MPGSQARRHPCGWMEPGMWMSSRSQLVRSTDGTFCIQGAFEGTTGIVESGVCPTRSGSVVVYTHVLHMLSKRTPAGKVPCLRKKMSRAEIGRKTECFRALGEEAGAERRTFQNIKQPDDPVALRGRERRLVGWRAGVAVDGKWCSTRRRRGGGRRRRRSLSLSLSCVGVSQ